MNRSPARPIIRRRLVLYGAFALAAMAINLMSNAGNIHQVLNGWLFDPDSFMRLVRIEQGMKLGHLVNLVHRDDSGMPMVVEWSRLLDGWIVITAAPLAPLFGWHRALLIAGVATGPLSAGLLGAGLAFAAAPLAGRSFLWSAPVVGLLLPGIRGFSQFGVIHYHILQIAMIAITAGFALRAADGRSRPAAWYSGIAGGIALWVMPETMPFVLLCFVGLGFIWLNRPIGGAIARLGVGFLATLAAALWLDPPYGGVFMPEIDRLSIVYVTLGLAVCAAGLWLAWLDRPLRTTLRAPLGIIGALAAFAIWLAIYPAVALGPYALIPASDMRVFFGHMAETQPITKPSEVALLLGPGILALLYVALRVYRGRRDVTTVGVWAIVAVGIMLSLGLTARFVIFQQYPSAFAAALLPVALNDISSSLRTRPLFAAMARIGSIAGVLVLPYGLAVALATSTPHVTEKRPNCAMRHIAPLMRPAAGAIVLTPVQDVPELLYRTRIIGVGSLYQHGIDGYLRAFHAWRVPPGDVEPAAVAATGAQFILFCLGGKKHPHVKHGTDHSLWHALGKDHPPAWLHLVGQDRKTGFRLYRITR